MYFFRKREKRHLDSPMVKVFPGFFFFFFFFFLQFWPSSGEKVQSWTKSALGPSRSRKSLNFSKVLQALFFSAKILALEQI